jgi:hypothetical protein
MIAQPDHRTSHSSPRRHMHAPTAAGPQPPAALGRSSGLARAAGGVLALLLWSGCAAADPAADQRSDRAAEALHRATGYFRNEVAVDGSYLWRYSADLSYRRGEGLATPHQGWVQPPGTPAVGMAYLQAYAATGDHAHLDGAIEAAHTLAATQLQSGGWFYSMEFDPEQRKTWCYRVEPVGCNYRDNRYRNSTTIDDNTSQSALRLLMLVDRALDESDPVIHEAVTYGLEQFVEAQYPNGAWSVSSHRRVPDEDAPAVGPARYPATWSREWVEPGRGGYVTNDNAMRDMIRTFLLADRLYGRPEYRAAALRAGGFLLDAQMPAPQAGWAQTYDSDMEPIWGRKFEPPAIASQETAGAIGALLDLYLYTGEDRYLDAAAAAVDWLEASRLPTGDWARFYELRTNQPLYMTRGYELTYDDGDLPRHYGFRGRFDIDEVRQAYREIKDQGRSAYLAGLAGSSERFRPALAFNDGRAVDAIMEQQDAEGRWLDDGMINSKTLIRNFQELARYIAAQRPAEGRTPARAIAAVADPLGTGLHAEVFGLAVPGPGGAGAGPEG